MKIFDGYMGIDAQDRGASAAIGNFDGLHKGHQALITEAARHAAQTGAHVGAITFNPHPRRFFHPDTPPFYLTTQAEKSRLLQKAGVSHLYRLAFDDHLATMEAETFVARVLHTGLGIRHLVIGADFHFGRGRRGDRALVEKLSQQYGFSLSVLDLIGDEAGEFASTAVRALIREGKVREASKALGRWHAVTGPVIRGDMRGRQLGYPTANLAFGDQLVPCYGIYAARVNVLAGQHKGCYDGIASIGERPTFGSNAPNFEVHLFDFKGDLYGAEIVAGLVERLRGEERFADADTLIAQMDRDSLAARAVLAQLPA